MSEEHDRNRDSSAGLIFLLLGLIGLVLLGAGGAVFWMSQRERQARLMAEERAVAMRELQDKQRVEQERFAEMKEKGAGRKTATASFILDDAPPQPSEAEVVNGIIRQAREAREKANEAGKVGKYAEAAKHFQESDKLLTTALATRERNPRLREELMTTLLEMAELHAGQVPQRKINEDDRIASQEATARAMKLLQSEPALPNKPELLLRILQIDFATAPEIAPAPRQK